MKCNLPGRPRKSQNSSVIKGFKKTRISGLENYLSLSCGFKNDASTSTKNRLTFPTFRRFSHFDFGQKQNFSVGAEEAWEKKKKQRRGGEKE